MFQIGILTFSSFYLLRLPNSLSFVLAISDFVQRSSLITAAGPSRILTGFPFKLLCEHLNSL